MNPNTNDRPESSSPETNNQPEIIYYQEEPILPQKEPKTRSLNPKKLLIAGAVTLTVLVGGWLGSLKLLTFLANENKCFGVDEIVCYNTAIFLNPFDGDLYVHRAERRPLKIPTYFRGDSEIEKSQINDAFRESMKDFNQAIRLQPSKAHFIYRSRGRLIFLFSFLLPDQEKTLNGQAIADLNEALRLSPNTNDYDNLLFKANTYYFLGDIKKSLGDKQGTIANYRKSSDLYLQIGEINASSELQKEIKDLGG